MLKYRLFAAAILGLLAASIAQGHFPFIVPDPNGDTAKIIFSDDLKPDKNVNLEKMANTKLTLRDAKGKESAIDWKKGDGFYAVNVPGTGTRVIYGSTVYGVLQRGDAKPFLLAYYTKAVIGNATDKETTIGEKLALEVVALGTPGKTKFRALAAGKPAANLEVTVILPNSTKKETKTDKDGYTPEYEGNGRFAVVAKWTEAKTGDLAGKKYEEIRSYATLVCDIGK